VLEELPLVCLACRTVDERGRNLSSLVIEGDVARCSDAACGRRYPIVDGIPIIVSDPAAFLAREIVEVVEHELPAEVAALLAQPGPDDAPYTRLVEHLSIYLDAHWGDRATPPVPFGLQGLAEKLAARPRVARAVELGCSVGRGLLAIAGGAELVVGLDVRMAPLRRARRLLAGESLGYARRVAGRHYVPASIAGQTAANVVLVCADAADPPLAPSGFDRVVALNVLDTVHNPSQLLAVVDGLCAPGGEVILASPYAWQSGYVGEGHRLGAADPAAEVVRRFAEGVDLEAAYTIEESVDVAWTLRRDARSSVAYSTHYLRARKSAR
jgi:SAM-dependent methyltransferase